MEEGRVTPDFDFEANWKMIQYLVDDGRLTFILLDRKIKKAYCELYEDDTDPDTQRALRFLRPAYSNGNKDVWHTTHVNHIHVRTQCPTDDPECSDTRQPPEGNGCSGEIINGRKEAL